MVEIFIAVFIVLSCMSTFLFLVLKKVVKQLNDKVKVEFIKNLEVYDSLIDKKEQRIEELNQELMSNDCEDNEEKVIEKVDREFFNDTTVVIEQAEYINNDFFKHYNKIQKEFNQPSLVSATNKLKELSRSRKDLNVHEYKELQDIFNHDLQYEVLTLVGSDEKYIFDFISEHSYAKKKIVDSYVSKFQNFDFMEFMMYVKDYIRTHDSAVYVYSREGTHLLDDSPKHVIYLVDETIHEGYRIRYRDMVFDYSI